jgi:hypothetical protein
MIEDGDRVAVRRLLTATANLMNDRSRQSIVLKTGRIAEDCHVSMPAS